MDHVFMVMLDWSTTDEDGFQIELFKNYDDAYDPVSKRSFQSR